MARLHRRGGARAHSVSNSTNRDELWIQRTCRISCAEPVPTLGSSPRAGFGGKCFSRPARLPGFEAAHRVPAMFEAKFQSFEDPDERSATAPRVAALRAELARRGLTGFIVPRADRHQNEYLPPAEERLAWLTGFTGSAGVAIVLADRAVIFVDGRYTLQVREQIDGDMFAVEHVTDAPLETWLQANLPAGTKLGYDPWLHTVDGAE